MYPEGRCFLMMPPIFGRSPPSSDPLVTIPLDLSKINDPFGVKNEKEDKLFTVISVFRKSSF